MPRGAGRKKKEEVARGPDPLGDAERQEVKRICSLLTTMVSYSMFIDDENPPDMDVFLRLRTLVILDRFFKLTDEQLYERLRTDPASLELLRQSEHYPKVAQAVRDAATRIAKPRGFGEWARDHEDGIAGEMYLMAMSPETGEREKRQVLEDFADRLEPKVSRGDGDAGVLRVPVEMLKLMQASLDLGKQYREESLRRRGLASDNPIDAEFSVIEEGEIDASKLNVPAPGR